VKRLFLLAVVMGSGLTAGAARGQKPPTLRLSVALIKRQAKKRGSFFEPKENTIDGRKIPMSILSTVQWPFKWRRTMTHLGFCRCRSTCHQNRLRAEMVV